VPRRERQHDYEALLVQDDEYIRRDNSSILQSCSRNEALATDSYSNARADGFRAPA
jgi:hypothetical protein